MDHLTRIHMAIDFIEEHLREDLSTEKIAKAAWFSPWHFQRIFRAAVGDTLKEYVRKRRLTAALVELKNSKKRILDLALEYGFESQESFTRAFKAMFGRPPGECRSRNFSPAAFLTKPRITREYLDHLYGQALSDPELKEFPETKVIGLSATFISIFAPDSNHDIVLPELWREFVPRLKEIKNRKARMTAGLCELVSDASKKSHPDEFLYTAGTEVTAFDTIPHGMVARTVPAGRYAVFTHKGKMEMLEYTMNYIFGSWLSNSGFELRDAADIELYDDSVKLNQDDSVFKICVPI
jgi:AraC family transcriptional regulator